MLLSCMTPAYRGTLCPAEAQARTRAVRRQLKGEEMVRASPFSIAMVQRTVAAALAGLATTSAPQTTATQPTTTTEATGPAPTGPARYVDPSHAEAQDAGSGSASQPYRTLTYAMRQLRAGETLV